MSPKVSVIIPAFNAASYLNKCFESVITQNHKNIEVIFIDDGSTDNSKEIAESYAKKDSRIKIIAQKNSGISCARNNAIEHSTGEYITFVDSDDWIHPNFITTMLKGIQSSDISACGYIREFEKKSIPRHLQHQGKVSQEIFKNTLVCPTQNNKINPATLDSHSTVWAKLYKSEIIKNHKIKFTSLSIIGTGEDLLFNIEYSCHIKNAYLIDTPLYHYRKSNSKSITSKYKPELFNQWKALHKKIQNHSRDDPRIIELLSYRLAISIIGLGLNELSNPYGITNKYLFIRQLLKDPEYTKSLSSLPLRSLKPHWALFFFMAKKNSPLGVILMLKTIRFLIGKL